MTEATQNKRLSAIMTANAINAIEGAPVSNYAIALSQSWLHGEITSEQMKVALLLSHKKLASQLQNHG